MSSTLYLVRHAIAEEYAPGGDAERALTPEGAAKMHRAAEGLARMEVRPERVLASPLRRAQETARIVCAKLTPRVEPETLEELAPGHSGAEVLHALSRLGSRALMLVGHEPDLGRLASFLLTGSPEAAAFVFRKGGVAAIDMPSCERGARGELNFFLTPKQLRALGRD